jgi:hypothetical protein
MKIRIDFYNLTDEEGAYGSACMKDEFFHLLTASSYVCFYITGDNAYPHVYISENKIKVELEENIRIIINKK